MNILIPHKWLLEHLETDATPQDIQKYLSLCGPSVERIYDREGDSVYDIEVTTNRVDGMSVRGVAREAAVILRQFGHKASLKKLEIPTPTSTQQLPLPKVINDPKLCRRTICVILKDVQRTPTPEWMAERLRQTDQNVHDSVIDITNYITHELGHPVHAFDYDKLMATGGEIRITEAKKGQKFITLDGNEYETLGGEVVFLNPDGQVIDLPAIKGTANTSINDDTKNVLLWLENLEPKKVRFASMSHAIRTVAAQLSEKNVDPHLAENVLLRGVELYQELCQAKVASPVYDEFPGQRNLSPVEVELKTIADYLGITLPVSDVTRILEDLECQVEANGDALLITPPTFRPDMTIPADVVEEVARIYGYHKLPSVLMDTAIPLAKQKGVNFRVENRIKRFLSDIGWQEVYTYSMMSEEVAQQSGYGLDDHLKLQNPLTDDRVYLRRSLVPSLAEVITANPNRKQLSVFEVANVYEPQDGNLPHEVLQLTLVSNREYREVRGELEALLKQFFIEEIAVIPDTQPQKGLVQSAMLNGIGSIGVTPQGLIAVVITIPDLLKVIKTHPAYQPIPKTTAIIEDMTFMIKSGTAIADVLKKIKNSSELVESVTLKDVYNQNYTFTINYLDKETNLSVEQVEPIRKQISLSLSEEFGAELVGAV